jgi:hypothetical protein
MALEVKALLFSDFDFNWVEFAKSRTGRFEGESAFPYHERFQKLKNRSFFGNQIPTPRLSTICMLQYSVANESHE